MKKWTVISIVLIASMMLSTSAFAQVVSSGKTLTAELVELDPFISIRYVNQVPLQEFDYEGAKQAGFSPESLELALEIVAYQNEYRLSVVSGNVMDDISIHTLNPAKFPNLAIYLSENSNIAAEQDSQNLITADPTPCGIKDYPVPNYTPSWFPFSGYPNPGQTLINWGFHKTAGYACGQDPLVTCDYDYTRGRSYSGPYGVCSSPRFRDQGIVVSSTSFNIQYGEPNPEILSYSWPYWNWGVYVQWWHNNY